MDNGIGKNLANLLRKTALISSIAVPLSFVSCKEENYPPVAGLEVNPTSGEVPLPVRMKSTSHDLNGDDDIKDYKLHINNEVINNNTPTDITRTFDTPGTYKVYEEVTDSKGLSDKSDVISIEVYRGPFIEQSASLFNDVEIKYTATLSRVNKAELKVNRDGALLLTEEVKDVNQSGVDYDKTFNYTNDGITKGNYEFVLKSENLEKKNLEKKTSVVVPNYPPTLNIDNTKIDLNEDSEITITVPKPKDKNPEDNKDISIKSVRSLDNKTLTTLEEYEDGYKLKIKALPKSIGDYKIELEYGSASGGLETKVLEGEIIKDTRMKVNPFVSTNSNGAAYGLLTTKAERESYIQAKLYEDWVNTILYHTNPLWDCTEFSLQLMTNFHGFPGLTGYSGDNLDSIYYYHGTYKDNGKYGIPIYFAHISTGAGHDMNAILTGDNATKFEDWSFIEPQRDSINVKPGHLYMQETFTIDIRAPPRDRDGKQYGVVKILGFDVKNKIPSLIWINEDPNLNFIKQR